MKEGILEELAKIPEALEPVYITPAANAPISLFEGDLQLILASGRTVSAPGLIEWRWLPHPVIRFGLRGLGHFPDSQDLSQARLNIPELNLSCGVSVANIGVGSEGTHYTGLLLSTPVIVGSDLECEQVIFQLPNFFSIIGEVIRNRTSSRTWTGRLRLESDDLIVVLDEMETARDLVKDLKDQGGFALTHSGVLERVDGGRFSCEEADDQLSALHYFLSFVRGFWCGPVLAVSRVDHADVWRQWACPHLTPWKYVETWFPLYDAFGGTSEISRAFRGFTAKWKSGLWKEPIKNSIHWYVESNVGAGGIEGAIVLAQTALELLSWLYLVEDPITRRLSIGNFNERMDAAERIRQLLSSLGIPTVIPASLDNLCSEAVNLNAGDGPQAIARLRNAIVHPKKTKRDTVLHLSALARIEAWKLGLWYVEMALLHLFGYEGAYYQRFLSGWPDEARAIVPWV